MSRLEFTEEEVLNYHEKAPSGKIFTGLAKSVETQRDLSVAYSPGVAIPCEKIAEKTDDSFRYTARGNLVGVVTNGTAVLGLGNIGPHAAKPVMEGKAMLFKKYADIDVFDIELDTKSPDEFIAAVKALEPTFGGINLEDIKAPECFYIEEKLREEMSIPVFHDDQHGTAIIAAAAFINALEITKKKIEEVKIVVSGAGAAALACAALFKSLGAKQENITLCDSKGVVNFKRGDLNEYKKRFAIDSPHTTLEQALEGADAFLGVSVADILKPEMLVSMAANPIIFALSNPNPEIHPDVAKKARKDAIIATGRSDFPNQVNNVLGFPFIFRGALDVRARIINEEMKLAAVYAIAKLAKEDVPDEVMEAYNTEEVYQFGRDYLIPKPVDPRVLFHIAPAVAKAAMDTGVARVNIDIEEYTQKIERVLGPRQQLVNRLRRNLHQFKLKSHKTPIIAIPHAYDRRVLRAASQVSSEGQVRICLLGSKKRILSKASELGLSNFENMIEIINPFKDDKIEEYANEFFNLRQRRGVSQTSAREFMHNHNYFASMMLKKGRVDGVVSGLSEPYTRAARPILEVIGTEGNHSLAGIYMLIHGERKYFFADCTINVDPSASELADIAMTTAKVAKDYTDREIRVAMLSYTSFGASKHQKAKNVAEAVKILKSQNIDFEVDGEMQADVALNSELRAREFPFCELTGDPNVFVFPDLASANITYKMLRGISRCELIGPILVGVKQPANVLQRSATTSEIASMIYITANQYLKSKMG